MAFNNLHTSLPFRSPLQPYATYFILFLLIILTLTNGFQVFFPSEWNVGDFLAAYITIPIFLALYLGHKAYAATTYVVKEISWNGRLQPLPMAKAWLGQWRLMHKVENIDAFTGKREMDELEALDEPPVPKNWLEKVWFWLA